MINYNGSGNCHPVFPVEMWKIISRGPKADDSVIERLLGNLGDFLGRLREREERSRREGEHNVDSG